MKLSAVNGVISTLLKSKDISLYDAFSQKSVAISKTTAFLYPPSLEKEKRVIYPNGTQVYFHRYYRFRLEITDKSITSSLCNDIAKLIDNNNGFFDIKLSEVKISKTTSLPHFFVEFMIIDSSLEPFTKSENEMVFSGLSVYAFIEGFNIENDFYTPHVTLADGSEYYATSKYRSRVYTVKLRFSSSLKDSFLNVSKTVVDSATTVKIDNTEYTTSRLINAQILSSDQYETTATLTFATA